MIIRDLFTSSGPETVSASCATSARRRSSLEVQCQCQAELRSKIAFSEGQLPYRLYSKMDTILTCFCSHSNQAFLPRS